MDWPKAALGLGIAIIIGIIASIELGILTNPNDLIPFGIIGAIIGGVLIIWKLFFSGKKESGPGRLNIYEVKYIVAKYLETDGINIFAKYDRKPENCRYSCQIHPNRFYPGSGKEEHWTVRLHIRDPRLYNGLDTRVTFLVDGNGKLYGDNTMNVNTWWDNKMWYHPEDYLAMKPSRAESRKSIHEVIAERMEERDEIPENLKDFTSAQSQPPQVKKENV